MKNLARMAIGGENGVDIGIMGESSSALICRAASENAASAVCNIERLAAALWRRLVLANMCKEWRSFI